MAHNIHTLKNGNRSRSILSLNFIPWDLFMSESQMGCPVGVISHKFHELNELVTPHVVLEYDLLMTTYTQ